MTSVSGLFHGRFLPGQDPLLTETWHEAFAEYLVRGARDATASAVRARSLLPARAAWLNISQCRSKLAVSLDGLCPKD